MTPYHLEQAAVMAGAFLAGAVVAHCVAPGNTALAAATGLAAAVLAGAFLAQEVGGDLFGTRRRHHWFHRSDDGRPREPVSTRR